MAEEVNLFGVEQTPEDKKYTTKVSVPQYLPSAECPKLYDVYDLTKYNELIRNINASNVSEEEKTFLRFAATRHIVFIYSKIADYYSHASPEMQKLMEDSALVIIDINDAIADGYVKLSKNIKDIMEKSGKQTADNEAKQETKQTV